MKRLLWNKDTQHAIGLFDIHDALKILKSAETTYAFNPVSAYKHVGFNYVKQYEEDKPIFCSLEMCHKIKNINNC